MLRKTISLYIIFWLLFLLSEPSFASMSSVVKICSVKGTVTTQLTGGNKCHLKRSIKQTECRVVRQGGYVETGPDGYATIEYQNRKIKTKIQPNTKIKLQGNSIYMLRGKSWFKVERRGEGFGFAIKTPTAMSGLCDSHACLNQYWNDTGGLIGWNKSNRTRGELVTRKPTSIPEFGGTEFLVEVAKDGATNIRIIAGALEISDKVNLNTLMLPAGKQVVMPANNVLLAPKPLLIAENQKWWTDWPTLIPLAEIPPNVTNGTVTPTPTTTTTGSTSGGGTGNIGSSTPTATDPLGIIADGYVYAYSYRNWNKANLGAYTQLRAGWHPTGGESRSYLKFDLSAMDSSRTNKAILRLYQLSADGNAGVNLGIYNVISPWLEGIGTYHSGQEEKTASPGELSWVQQPALEHQAIATFNPGSIQQGWIDVDITPLVQKWLSGSPNHGLVIKAEGQFSQNAGQSVYNFASRERKINKAPKLVLFSQAGSIQPASYLGCYKDQGNRDLSGYSFNFGNMTTERCIAGCRSKGFAYAATQFSNSCFCDTDYGKYGPSDACKMPCSGNSDEICGGYWANSVWNASKANSFQSPDQFEEKLPPAKITITDYNSYGEYPEKGILRGNYYIFNHRNGTSSEYEIKRFDKSGVHISRVDIKGQTAGIRGEYIGKITGSKTAEGTATWTWIKWGEPLKGTWKANW